ncbi:hypothetical protein TNCV_2980961 [Trichonephila clavipes]|nr:hypothetical protein TNCV_2980961 [Trichonephila clavipes]
MQSKGYNRLDAERKGQSLQDACKLFAWKFVFQIHEQAEAPVSTYIVVRLMTSQSPSCADVDALWRPWLTFLAIVPFV